MRIVDCAIFYEWEYDQDFVARLGNQLRAREIEPEIYRPGDFERLAAGLTEGKVAFRIALDRASDVDEKCEALVGILSREGTKIVNDPLLMRHASDKASMHLEFITGGIHVPYTIIISPYTDEEEVKLSLTELSLLGRPFIIKPANTTGGGIGVVTGAENLHDVVETRKHHKNDKYLLQQKIEPVKFDGRRAWFRPFYVFGQVLVCWWDDQTHIYAPATPDEIERFNLVSIKDVVKKIYRVCRLDFFSTEIAATPDGRLVVIDYVNEMCDMRLKSGHYDGVPDEIVDMVAGRLAQGAKDYLAGNR